jgi:hypothetical protein
MKLLTIALFAFFSLAASAAELRRYTVADIEAAIRSGKVDADLAERAKKVEQLYVAETRGEKIPYQLFTFSDFRGGYTLLVEAEEKFVILCTSIGGGYADQFTMTKDAGRTTLHYRYTSGSGRLFEHRAKYVIGSGKPEETQGRRDNTGK